MFAPDNVLTRAEAAVILVRAMGLEKKVDDEAGSIAQFTDISEHWGRNEIETAACHGIVLGTGDGKFSPDKHLTRQEMAVMLDRILVHLQDANNARIHIPTSAEKQFRSYDAIVKLTLQCLHGKPGQDRCWQKHHQELRLDGGYGKSSTLSER